MTRLTTHVLDTAQGIPAERVACTLFRIDGETCIPAAEGRTNADGRLDRPLLEGDAFVVATYELVFEIGAYFHHQPLETSEPPFLDVVTIRFTVADATAHYHVPLLVSPWAYSTYRGS
jgi:5-hydroxyisourate hydrolase